MPILKNWRTAKYYSDLSEFCLVGEIYNDTRFEDGTEIRTSEVLELKNGYARTRNTTYILE